MGTMKRLRLILLLGVAVALTLAVRTHAIPPAAQAPTQIAAPRLKWQYGGCSGGYCQRGWYSSPAIADLDGDAQPEVIGGAYDVVALNGESGTVQWRAANGSRVWPGIALADLTGNGSLEVIVGRGSDQVTVYDSAGVAQWTRNPFGGGEVRTLAVADLEQDGQIEIIAGRASGGATNQLTVYEPDGSVRAGWPARRANEPGYGAGMYNENVTVADLDGNGAKEIIGPTDTHYITALDGGGNQLPANAMYGAGKVWSQVGVHVDHAVDLRGYAECGAEHRPNFADAAPAIADVDGNGGLEIIIPGDVYNCAVGDPAGDLYYLPWILRLDRTRWSGAGFDWTALPAPAPNSGPLSEDYAVIERSAVNAVVADLDSDGLQEILYPSYDGRLHAYWLDKTQRHSWPFAVPGSGIRFASEPSVVDLDSDGLAEILFTSWPEKRDNLVGQLHILDHRGTQLHAIDLPAPATGATWNGGLAAPTVGNIDADADLEVVVNTATSGLVAYDLPGSAQARILWGTGRASYQRTGAAMTLSAGPTVRRIGFGGSASYTITLGGGLPGAATLSASVPAGLAYALAPATLSGPGQATLTITDTHTISVAPGLWYPIRVTATSGTAAQSADLGVLVDGGALYAPLLRR